MKLEDLRELKETMDKRSKYCFADCGEDFCECKEEANAAMYARTLLMSKLDEIIDLALELGKDK